MDIARAHAVVDVSQAIIHTAKARVHRAAEHAPRQACGDRCAPFPCAWRATCRATNTPSASTWATRSSRHNQSANARCFPSK